MKLLKQLWHGLYIRLLTKISPVISNAVNGKLQSEAERLLLRARWIVIGYNQNVAGIKC